MILAGIAREVTHRGPVREGLDIQGPVRLGHRRLAIVDLSSDDHQPMMSATGQLRTELCELAGAFRH